MVIPNQVKIKMLKIEEMAYLAGFIDGEGAFMINRRIHHRGDYQYIGYSAYIDIGNTNEFVMKWIKTVTECTCNIYKQKQSNNRRDMYRLRIGGKQAIELTKTILPYLKVKRELAEKFILYPLKHRKLDKPIAEQLFADFREINKNNGKGHANIKQEVQILCV